MDVGAEAFQRTASRSEVSDKTLHFDKLPVVDCEGSTPWEIGFSHGSQLQERVAETLSFYYDIYEEHGFGRDEVRAWGEALAGTVRRFSPDIAEEVEGVADGAGRARWELFALQGRTELLGIALHRAKRPSPGECTSICCPASAVVAQNWDWDPVMNALIVLLRLPRCGSRPQMLTLTEAGIVGKVGLNEHGVGTCINILFGREPAPSPDAVPVHVLARAALSCGSLEEAEAVLRGAPRHCYTHLLLADRDGRYRMAEFCGAELGVMGEEHDGGAPPPARAHTNHYLHPSFLGVDAESDLCHTRVRHQRAEDIIREQGGGRRPGEGLALVRRVLGDREGQPKSILYSSAPGITPHRTLGTLCSMILDLHRLQMQITKGDAMRQEYSTVGLWPPQHPPSAAAARCAPPSGACCSSSSRVAEAAGA